MSAVNIPQELIEKAIAFHGHWCPGLARGIRVASWVIENLGTAADEEIVAITETDMCAVDAIQALVGCTFGKGNLIFQDKGKVAFSFYRRSDGKCVRIVEKVRMDAESLRSRHLKELLASGGTSEEQARNAEAELACLRQKDIERLLAAPFEMLFDLKKPGMPLPPMAKRLPTFICAQCGEGVMSSRTILRNGRCLCLDCAELG